MNVSRRNLLRKAWEASTALLGGAAIWTSWEMLRPLRDANAGGVMKVGNPADYKLGTATYVREGRFWIVNAEGHLRALSQKCSHLGCGVPFCESSGFFECPCHGSKFNIGGEWITGPAPRGMDQHPLAIVGHDLTVDTSTKTPGPDHGSAKFSSKSLGPSCEGGQ